MKQKSIHAKNAPGGVILPLLFFLCLCSWDVGAQGELKCGKITRESPDTLNYMDRFGNWYLEEEIRFLAMTAQQSDCDQIEDFQLIFDDNPAFTQSEMETICDVFTYLSDLIVAPSGQQAIIHLSKQSLPSGVGATGTAFFAPQCGVGHSIVHEQLFTGGVNSPVHALIEVNSNLTDFYIGPEMGIDTDEYDFYTVILHEALHVLGFGSQIIQSGQPMQGFYTLWDLNLRNATGDFMIESSSGGSGTCCATYSFNHSDFPDMPDIIWDQDCGVDNVLFDVSELPPVNGEYSGSPTDATFMQVLSHLDRTCGSEHFVMNSGIPPGSDGVQRTLTDAENSILCQLGFETTECSPECIAVAGNDGNFFVGLNETINLSINDLLSNDFPNNATFALKTDCGDQSGITVDVNGNFVEVTGDALGAYNFCYTITSCNGSRCDVGFVRIVVANPAIVEACANTEPCQINPFWDFELFGSPDEMYPLLTLGDGNGMGDGVPGTGFTFYSNPQVISDNTPDLWQNPITIVDNRGCGSDEINNINTPFGNQALGMIVRRFNETSLPEGVNFPLCEPIFPGMSGSVTFYGMTPQACIGTSDPQVRVEFSEDPPVDQQVVYVNPGISSPSWFVPITTTQNTSPVFGLYTVDFINETEDCWNYLYLSSFTEVSNFPPPLSGFGYIVVDNVRVELEHDLSELLDISTEIDETEPCMGDIVTLEIEFCNTVACLPNIYTNPEFQITGVLPYGLTHLPNGDFPSLSNWVQAAGIQYGTCITLELMLQVGNDPELEEKELEIGLDFAFSPDLCYENFSLPAGSVTPMLCVTDTFTCACPPGGLNINASMSSPHYDPALGGVPYTALHDAFMYDQNEDGIISQSEHNDCIAILGRLIVDRDFSIVQCDNVQMQPCSEIVVGTSTAYTTLDLANNVMYGCDVMWKGITVNPHSALVFKGNTIRDAQFAISAIGSSGLGINPPTRMAANGNTFDNNHVGVLFPGNAFTTVNHIPFTDNTFTGTADLLPPCDATLPNYSSTLRGFAGVVTQGTSLMVGTKGLSGISNTFSKIRNGVISSHAVLHVFRGDFQDILGPTSPNVANINTSRGIGVVVNGGTAMVAQNTFNNVTTGIFAYQGQRLSALYNTFNPVYRGIEARRISSTNIADNVAIGFMHFGILLREVPPAGGLMSHRISNNTNMFYTPFSGVGATYSVAIDIDNAMSTDVLQGRISNNHYLSGGTQTDGIRINGAGGWDIDGNTIDFEAPASPSFNNPGMGLRLSNTNGNYLYANTFNEFDAIGRQSTGMELDMGTGNRYCCNATYGHLTGTRFFGPCSATEWRVTDMGAHSRALSCAAGTAIDPQFDHGNLFNTGSGTAFHGGDDFEVQQSQFRVQNMSQPHWPVAISTPNTSVQFFIQPGTAPSCVSPCTAPSFAPPPPDREIKESDLVTAVSGWGSSAYGGMLQWESSRRLYERMLDYPELLGDTATTDAFYAGVATGVIGAYIQAERQAKAIYHYPAALADTIGSMLELVELNQLAVDSILTDLTSALTALDSATIYLNANVQHAAIEPISAGLLKASFLAADSRVASSMSALSLTNPLMADSLLAQNRKTVQQIFLQTVAMGYFTLDSAQMAEVSEIAFQCPLQGGSAVYAARALYRLNEDYVFSDDSLCTGSYERQDISPRQPSVAKLYLMPNPATEMVTIAGLSPDTRQPLRVSLMGADGRLCMDRTMGTDAPFFSVSSLAPGLYFCRIQVAGEVPKTLKLIVSH